MTYSELEKAITAAHRNGNFRLADDLETEAQCRRIAYQDALDMAKNRKPDNSRRSFKG